MPADVPPFLPFVVAALLAPLGPRWWRGLLMLAAPAAAGAALLVWPRGDAGAWSVALGGLELSACRVDGLGAIFAGLFCLAAFLAGLFTLHVKDRMQAPAGLLYAGSAVGSALAGDFVTLFLWVELMALSSVFLIWARGGDRAMAAGWRYLLWQLASGLLLLAGAIWRMHATGSAAIGPLSLDDPGALVLFAAFGVKAAFPLVHVWLTDAYPEATVTGTVWLSSFTTKVGVYALARCFPGAEPLIWIGAAMTIFPIFYAVIENDLRRVLTYSMVNQVGFMVCGIGLGTQLSLAGAVSHACNDVVFKGLLLMSMGAVLHQTGRIGADRLGGLWRSMPRTATFCVVGAASISAFPLFSGFVSKSMVMAAALEQGQPWLWLVLLFASAGVLEHAGIKIPYFAFFAHDSGLRPGEPPRNMLAAMGISAVLCVLVGSFPELLYRLLPYSFEYHPYDVTHVVTQMQLLLFAALAVAWLHRVGWYPREIPAVNLDADWVLRRAVPRMARGIFGVIEPAVLGARRIVFAVGERTWRGLERSHGPRGPLARVWPTDSMMLWMAVLLAVLLVLYYR